MINEVKLDGRIEASHSDEYPTITEITRKKDQAVLGYSARIRYSTGEGAGWIQVKHWSAHSPLKDAVAGQTIVIEGALDFDQWENEKGKRSATTLRANSIELV